MRSIRIRLTLWYTGLLTVTLLIVAGASYVLLSYNLSHQIDASLESVAKALTERAHARSSTFVPSEIDEIFRRFFGFSPWAPYFQMLDPHGNRDSRQSSQSSTRVPISKDALNNALHGISSYETVEGLGEHPVRVLNMPVMESGRMINLIQVGMSLKNIHETRFLFLLIMAGILPLGLALSAYGGWLLAHRALKPVDEMTAAARRISAEQLGERLNETGTDDELDNLAKTLNQMLTRLDAAFSQVRRFSADASHELQTPLTILKGEMELALRSPRSPEEYRETLGSALEEVDRISQLVEGLLLLARAEAGVLRMDRQPVDLGEVVEDAGRRLQVVAESRSIEIHIDLHLEAVEPLIVQGDRDRLQRMVLNLVENAIKYTRPAGHVRLSLKREGQWAVILVSDDGVGIPEEEREQIFQPFYRSADALSMEVKGTGLGLSIARSIAQAHGGTIRVESTVGGGSTFKVSIPAFSVPVVPV
jgi:two-component system, OmpR family, sensor kinase